MNKDLRDITTDREFIVFAIITTAATTVVLELIAGRITHVVATLSSNLFG